MAFSLGPNTLSVSARLFAENRTRLVAALRKVVGPASVVLLQGGVGSGRYNTDADDLPFRQVSLFDSTYFFVRSRTFSGHSVFMRARRLVLSTLTRVAPSSFRHGFILRMPFGRESEFQSLLFPCFVNDA